MPQGEIRLPLHRPHWQTRWYYLEEFVVRSSQDSQLRKATGSPRVSSLTNSLTRNPKTTPYMLLAVMPD
jgi:hypothetical protein